MVRSALFSLGASTLACWALLSGPELLTAQTVRSSSVYTDDAPGLLEAELDNAEKLVVADDQPSEEADDDNIIRERYPNRTVRIERQVSQDEEGNYFNHGRWTMWSPEGRLMARGEYVNGQRHGKWVRWFAAGEGEMFQGDIYAQFEPPFVSQVEFDHGVINGAWVVMDSQRREVCAWEFRDGRRHGASIWWYPNGEKWREVTYRNGDVHGVVMEYAPDGQLLHSQRHINGRRLGLKTEYYAPGLKKYEAEYLHARPVLESTDDWWAGVTRVKIVGQEGKDQRHGRWTSWDKGGQKILEGRYEHDVPVGKFTWWHSNGQKSIEGSYAGGKQEGVWSWWHPTGQKHIEGYYTEGHQTGIWTWWDKAGKVAASTDYDAEPTNEIDVSTTAGMPTLAPRDGEIIIESDGSIVIGISPDGKPGELSLDEKLLNAIRPPFKLLAPTRK